MPRTAFLERKSSIRVLGAAFLAMLLFFVWLTYAFFNKTFVDSVPVTLTTSRTGLQLPTNADVKLKGMTVGEVRDIEPFEGGVKIKIAMFPETIKLVPKNVTAELVPKTLFGEKFVSLLAPDNSSGQSLQAGDNIQKANVPIEVEELLNDLYPLLNAVQPAELSYTLTAIAEALDGRGDQIGETLVKTNEYLTKINPDVPALVDDLVDLGTVADGYADAMPDLGRLLKNVVVTGNTVVAKQSQMEAFYKEGARLSDTTRGFLRDNGDNMITLADEGQPLLQVLSDYSSTFGCTLAGINDLIPKLNDQFRGNTLHINLELLPEKDQPTAYKNSEPPIMPTREKVANLPAAQPDCFNLPKAPYEKPFQFPNKEYDQENPGPIPPYSIYKLVGIENPHNKFCGGNEANKKDPNCNESAAPGAPRSAVNDQALIDMVQPSLDKTNNASNRSYINTLVGPSLGIDRADMPDVASLMLAPIMDGMGVRVSEAR